MTNDNWTKNAKGNIFSHPLTGFQSLIGGLQTVWRIEWSEAVVGSSRRRAKSVQVHMDAETAKAIAEEILRNVGAGLPPVQGRN